MTNVFDVAEALVSHAVKTHGDMIGIIAYYGSYATGTARDSSDLDLFYVPDDIKSTLGLYCSFILDHRAFEFWPISWQRLERIASALEHWPVSAGLISNSRTLYSRSEEDLNRFKALKLTIKELQTPEKKPEMVKKALSSFTTVLNSLGKLRLEAKKGHFPGLRWAGWEVITSSVECLALVNQTYFNKGWGSNQEEVLSLKDKPENLAELIETISTSKDVETVLTTSEELAYETREILLRAQRKVGKGETVRTVFKDYFPGIFEYVNKVISSVEENKPVAANYAAAKIQFECNSFLSRALTGVDHGDFNLYSEYYDLYRENKFPNLMELAAPEEYSRLVEYANKLDEVSRAYFKKANVELNMVDDMEHLKRFIEERANSGQ